MPQSLTRVVDILSYLLHSGSWVCLFSFIILDGSLLTALRPLLAKACAADCILGAMSEYTSEELLANQIAVIGLLALRSLVVCRVS